MFQLLARGFASNALTVFRRKNLLWHVLAITLTVIFVLSGFDWWFYMMTRSSLLYPLVWAAGLGGFFVPVLVPLGMYIVGEIRHDEKMMDAAAAIAQAIIIAFLVSFLYKAFTGRIQPEFLGVGAGLDNSKDFQFGILRHGVFWGWPSSHAAVAFAGSTALLRLVRSRTVQTLAFVYVALIATGAAIGFHWFSDVVAGAILGTLIGFVVSRYRSDRITD